MRRLGAGLPKERQPGLCGGRRRRRGDSLLLFLVNGAVGFLGDEGNPVNLLFYGVLTAAVAGAIVVRFRAEGMARAMAVTAGVQVATGLIGVLLVPDVRGFLVGTTLFTPLWLLAAWLFGRAARG